MTIIIPQPILNLKLSLNQVAAMGGPHLIKSKIPSLLYNKPSSEFYYKEFFLNTIRLSILVAFSKGLCKNNKEFYFHTFFMAITINHSEIIKFPPTHNEKSDS